MLDIFITVFRKILTNKKQRLILFVMLLSVFYRFVNFFYNKYYISEIEYAEFVDINCNGTLDFKNNKKNFTVNPIMKKMAIPNCINFSNKGKEKWNSYKKSIYSVFLNQDDLKKQDFKIIFNKKNITFFKNDGIVYNQFDQTNVNEQIERNFILFYK